MAPRILAFDTSAGSTSVAVCEGARVLREDDSAGSDRHAEILLPRVQQCLAACALRLEDIDLFAVGIGPGSFTGVRVGVATAKGLGLGMQRPVSGVVSLEALCVGARARRDQGEWLAPLLDAFKGEVFGGLYRVSDRGLEQVLAPFHAAPAIALERITLAASGHAFATFGTGLRRYSAELGPLPDAATALDASFDAPRARHIASLGLLAFERGELPSLADLAPLYVRGSDAQLPKTALRL